MSLDFLIKSFFRLLDFLLECCFKLVESIGKWIEPICKWIEPICKLFDRFLSTPCVSLSTLAFCIFEIASVVYPLSIVFGTVSFLFWVAGGFFLFLNPMILEDIFNGKILRRLNSQILSFITGSVISLFVLNINFRFLFSYLWESAKTNPIYALLYP